MFQSLLVLQKNDDTSWDAISSDLGKFFEQNFCKNGNSSTGVPKETKSTILTLDNIVTGFKELGVTVLNPDLRSLVERFDFSFQGKFQVKF